jgi:hypothetical protein
LAVFLPAFLWQARRRRWPALTAAGLWTLAFGGLALQSRRYIPYFMLLALLWAASQPWPRLRRFRQASLALAVGLLLSLAFWRYSDPDLGHYEPLWQKFPVGAAEFLAQDPPAGRLANAHWDGDYLLWRLGPEQKVFIDSRQDLYAVRYVHEARLYGAAAQWRDVVQGYGFSAILMPLQPTPPPLREALAQDKDWRVVYRDNSSELWARRGEKGKRGTWKALARAKSRRLELSEPGGL